MTQLDRDRECAVFQHTRPLKSLCAIALMDGVIFRLERRDSSLWRHFTRPFATLEVIQGCPYLRGAPWLGA